MRLDKLKNIPLKTWISLVIVLVLYIALCIWVGSPWLWIGVPLIIDGYITKKINWRWWKNSPKPWVRSVMKFVEDIVVVVVFVQVFFTLFFQNFQIPTSSLEKSYLVGDYLFVSKLSYGPRLPMTPISFPLFHNVFPWGGKTYLDNPQRPYKRLKGLGQVERNDIVVFNFPAGDTITTGVPVPDYYTLVHAYGRERVWGDKQTFGDIVYRPVDKRDHYVKRCVGMPGDSLSIVNNALYIDGVRMKDPEKMQLNYYVQTDGSFITEPQFRALGIANDDIVLIDGGQGQYQPFFDYIKLQPIKGAHYGLVYQLPLTKQMLEEIKKLSHVRNVVIEPSPSAKDDPTFPLEMETGWTRDNYGPIWIPKKGATVRLTLENLPLYERCIRNFEGHSLAVKEGRIYIDGTATDTYTFEMDYYFMMGDNRHKSADSRSWGFVPEDHIVGSPVWVWISVDKDRSWFKGKFRWDRFFLLSSKIK